MEKWNERGKEDEKRSKRAEMRKGGERGKEKKKNGARDGKRR